MKSSVLLKSVLAATVMAAISGHAFAQQYDDPNVYYQWPDEQQYDGLVWQPQNQNTYQREVDSFGAAVGQVIVRGTTPWGAAAEYMFWPEWVE
jgi:hypothetical protein